MRTLSIAALRPHLLADIFPSRNRVFFRHRRLTADDQIATTRTEGEYHVTERPFQQLKVGQCRTQPCSTKSLDDGFFDSSLLRKEEETSSEALTSISNLHKETSEYVPEEGPYY